MKFVESDQIGDSRFAAIQNDPRFIRPRRKQTKVQLDSRFRHLLDSKEFEFVQKVDKYGRPANLSRERVDLKRFYRADAQDRSLAKDHSDTKRVQKPVDNKDGHVSGSSSDESESEQPEDGEQFMDFARGKVAVSSSSDESEGEGGRQAAFNSEGESESGDDDHNLDDGMRLADSDEDSADEDIIPLNGGGCDDDFMTAGAGEENEVDAGVILQKDNVPLGDGSRRIAVVNMDWDSVKAHDLLKLFDAFKPAGGVIYSVKIYPSEFGKERMAIEERQGPPADIFTDPRNNQAAHDNDDDVDSGSNNGDTQDVIKEMLASTDAKVEFNQAALRRYQLERLRYFYAVVDCDSIKTAKAIYDQCDGSEYESSAVFLDLRYVPDGLEFVGEEPRDIATEVPVNFQPKEFVTTALQHSRVRLTWDEDDPERLMVTRKKFTKDDLKDMDFKAYLASDIDDDEDEDEDDGNDDDNVNDDNEGLQSASGGRKKVSRKKSKAESMRAKYRALLDAADNSDSNEDGDDVAANGKKDEEFEDMEITFAPGLSNLANKLLQAKREKSQRQNETVFETYLREKREKRKSNKKSKKENQEHNDLVSEDDERDIAAMANDDFFKDAFAGPEFKLPAEAEQKHHADSSAAAATGKKRSKKRKGDEGEQQSADPDLELLFMDETENGLQKKHFDMDEIVKSNKKKAKKKRSSQSDVAANDEDKFDINVSDDRFKALFESSEYAIDPTSAKFKKTKAMERLLQERRDRNAHRTGSATGRDVQKGQNSANDAAIGGGGLQSMVQRIKQKASADKILKKGKRA